MTLRTPQEIDPCVGRLKSGEIVVVMRGSDGRTQTREFREGDVIDASAVGAVYVQLNFFCQGTSTPVLRLELSNQENVTVPKSLLDAELKFDAVQFYRNLSR